MKRRDLVLFGLIATVVPLAQAGAWDSGSFDNDDAQDWVAQCIRSKGATRIATALEAALSDGYIDAPECSAAVAAAEVVAAARGRPSASVPKELVSWLTQQPKDEIAKLAPVASKAVSRVQNGPKSELQETWKGSPEFAAWRGHMQDLAARLK